MISVVIPSRSPQFLQKTIDDLLAKAKGDVEIIVVLDGIWPDPPVKTDPHVIVLHHGEVHNNKGMRESINLGMNITKGEYVMKIDEHCMIDQDWDAKLIADCDENWVICPRRFRLDAETWTLSKDPRPPVDYAYLAYPYQRIHDNTCGFHGEEWRRPERKDILIDENITIQGSFYFTPRKWWFQMIGPLDESIYGTFTHEAQEVTNNSWFGGGKVMVNKKTWYAHFHKGSHGKGYGFSNEQYRVHQAEKERGRKNCIDYWFYNKFPRRVHDFEWLIDKFWPIPGWPENWREQIEIDRAKELCTT
jgi:glycosyltransferase involved in cell wall biosynthesis